MPEKISTDNFFLIESTVDLEKTIIQRILDGSIKNANDPDLKALYEARTVDTFIPAGKRTCGFIEIAEKIADCLNDKELFELNSLLIEVEFDEADDGNCAFRSNFNLGKALLQEEQKRTLQEKISLNKELPANLLAHSVKVCSFFVTKTKRILKSHEIYNLLNISVFAKSNPDNPLIAKPGILEELVDSDMELIQKNEPLPENRIPQFNTANDASYETKKRDFLSKLQEKKHASYALGKPDEKQYKFNQADIKFILKTYRKKKKTKDIILKNTFGLLLFGFEFKSTQSYISAETLAVLEDQKNNLEEKNESINDYMKNKDNKNKDLFSVINNVAAKTRRR